jgi:hypothetical protein
MMKTPSLLMLVLKRFTSQGDVQHKLQHELRFEVMMELELVILA